MDTLTITRPDDFHLHLRDGAELASIAGDSARQFARAVIMPNLKPPVTTVDQAMAYRKRVIAALPAGSTFEPLMTLYLTGNTTAGDIHALAENPFIHAVKYYPAGATTHSDEGVTRVEQVYHVLEVMEELGVPLLMHGEVTDPAIDLYDREPVFIDTVLEPLSRRFSRLKMVLEHISTGSAVDFIMQGPETIAATITPQHLLYNRNAMFDGGLRPHYYCLPVLKRETHRQAVMRAAVSGHPRFFLGTDSAPHGRAAKESVCGCAGIYSAHNALELYAEIFEESGNLDKLEQFSGFNGADFYGLPRNEGTITLVRQEWQVPESLPFAGSELVPLRAGEKCRWMLDTR